MFNNKGSYFSISFSKDALDEIDAGVEVLKRENASRVDEIDRAMFVRQALSYALSRLKDGSATSTPADLPN